MNMPGPSRDASLDSLFAPHGGRTGAFSAKVADYAAARPGYPTELFDQLTARGALFAGAMVADVGAGTGLFARELLRRGYAVTAIEPNQAMRAAADELLSGHPAYRSRAGRGEATGLDAASVDLVTVAQAFHWFDATDARRECLRILRPAGRVVLVWNTRPLADPVQLAIDDILARFGGNKHVVLTAQQDLSQVPAFFNGAACDRLQFEHAQRVDRDGLLSLVFSRSSMPGRGSVDGNRAARALNSLFDRNASDGQLTVNYCTVAFLGRPAPDRESQQ